VVGVMVAVDGVGNSCLGYARDGARDVVPDGGRRVNGDDPVGGDEEDHLVKAVGQPVGPLGDLLDEVAGLGDGRPFRWRRDWRGRRRRASGGRRGRRGLLAEQCRRRDRRRRQAG
jgi:hypothetical protein